MKIVLNDTWFIEGIPLNLVLKQKKLSKGTGRNAGDLRIIEVDQGYFTTVEGALRSYLRKIAKECTEDYKGDLEGYITRLENIYDDNFERFEKALKGAGYGNRTSD